MAFLMGALTFNAASSSAFSIIPMKTSRSLIMSPGIDSSAAMISAWNA